MVPSEEPTIPAAKALPRRCDNLRDRHTSAPCSDPPDGWRKNYVDGGRCQRIRLTRSSGPDLHECIVGPPVAFYWPPVSFLQFAGHLLDVHNREKCYLALAFSFFGSFGGIDPKVSIACNRASSAMCARSRI
jgi:hypothetical protein